MLVVRNGQGCWSSFGEYFPASGGVVKDPKDPTTVQGGVYMPPRNKAESGIKKNLTRYPTPFRPIHLRRRSPAPLTLPRLLCCTAWCSAPTAWRRCRPTSATTPIREWTPPQAIPLLRGQTPSRRSTTTAKPSVDLRRAGRLSATIGLIPCYIPTFTLCIKRLNGGCTQSWPRHCWPRSIAPTRGRIP